MAKSNLPFGSEFSPSQIELPRLLELASRAAGNIEVLTASIRAQYFEKVDRSEQNTAKLAYNCVLGMRSYGVIDDQGRLTDSGNRLLDIRSDEASLYRQLARHILLNRNGMSLVQCIQDMMYSGEEVNLTSLRAGLSARGIDYPPGGKHPSMMRLWLSKAGVFIGDRWQVDQERLKQILGSDPGEFDALAALSTEQRAFLRALVNTGKADPQPANEIARLAETTFGVKFPEKSMPKQVLNALVNAGYITITKTTKGRGAKPFLVVPTPKLVSEIVEPMLKQLAHQTDPKLFALLKRPLKEIRRDLDSNQKHIRGLALEALGFKLMRLLDMDYVATRLRGIATGGAEVDLIFHSARLVYSRWQVQCKNTGSVSLDDVAKEVGLTHMLKSNVIVMVTTGVIGAEARRYANRIMTDSNLAVVMIDGKDLDAISTTPAAIVTAFGREAHHAMNLKQIEIRATP